MASSQIQIQSDSTEETEPVVADPAQDNTTTATIDNVFTASEHGDLEKLRKLVEQDGASLSSRDNEPDNDGCYALHQAARNSHTEIVHYIIEHGGDVNAVSNSQLTALHCAAHGGSISVADVLLQKGAHVEAADINGSRAVHYAAANGKTSFLNHIVTMYNADFDVQDNEGRRPLHLAADKNFPEMVQYIIEHGGDVNAIDNDKKTALHYAAVGGHVSVADVLLQNEAQVEAADVNGLRALHVAAQNGQTSFLNHIVSKYNADIDVPANVGQMPLHMAAINNRLEIVQYLIEHGGDVNAIDNDKHTALHYAANGGHMSVADVLLQNEAQVEAANVDGLRALHVAAQNGQTLFLNHIVAKYNADFDVRDNEGRSALHWAAMGNHHEIVQYIIEHGGDVNVIDSAKKTALHYAAELGWISVADVLLQNGAHVKDVDVNGLRAIHYAAQNGKTSFLKHIVSKYNVDFDVQDNDGWSPLHWAVGYNHHETVQYIIEHGGDVNAVNNFQETALHLAVMHGSISVADLLLRNGAHVEVVDENGHRAVHYAAIQRQPSFLKHIVAKHNADFDVPDNVGKSPLHWAAGNGLVDTITWLLSKNASQKRQDIHGRTPLHIAAFCGHINAFMALKDAATKQEMMIKDNEGNTAIDLSPILKSIALYEECKNTRNWHFEEIAKGTNRPIVIVVDGDAYTGKSHLARELALKIKCPIISLDNFLDGTYPTGKKRDTLISNIFKIITEIVRTQIDLGLSVIVDAPLSRLSDLKKLANLTCCQITKLLIIECKPKNEYAYQLRFEETCAAKYNITWHKPEGLWPLPKVPRDYTDNDIPFWVSKLTVDTSDNYATCRLLAAIFDVASCYYNHKTKYDEDWEFIHRDKKEQFTCPCPSCKFKSPNNTAIHFHAFTFHEGGDLSDTLCGACDFLVDGPRYTCMDDCPLMLHQSCAEVGRGEKKHFVPESLSNFTRPYLSWCQFPVERPCAECRKDGKSLSRKCNHCLFESHLKSRLLPTVVRHKAHDNFLTLWLNFYEVDASSTSYVCLACRKEGKLAAYRYGRHMYHLDCLLLPTSVHHSHDGNNHDLEMITRRVEKMEDYLCDCCLKRMDPCMWYYYCSECNISLHLKCAFLDFDTGEPFKQDPS